MFNQTITLGKIRGIPIRIHTSLLLAIPLLIWVLGVNVDSLAQEHGGINLSPYVLGFMVVVGLYVSVALHELGHSFMAMARGIEIQDITLVIFGGAARMDDEFSKRPTDELVIAFSGPGVSLVLGGVFLALAYLVALPTELFILVYYLGQINLILALFNLLPAFPTDGGRILRSLLAKKQSFLKATKIAVSVGQLFAVLFGIFGFLAGNLFLILIAVFVYMAASQEYQTALMKQTLSDFTVGDLLTKDVVTIDHRMTVQALLEQMYAQRHQGYPVMADGDLVGCVTMEDIQKIRPQLREFKTVSDIMSTEIFSVSPQDDIYMALKRLSEHDIGRLMVLEDDALVGIITRTDIIRGFRLKLLETGENGE